MAIEFLISLIGVFLVTVLLLKWLIPVLISKKVGQRILTIGPRWHQSKEGTPTMGGITFILAILLVMSGFAIYSFVGGKNERLFVGGVFTHRSVVRRKLIGIRMLLSTKLPVSSKNRQIIRKLVANFNCNWIAELLTDC